MYDVFEILLQKILNIAGTSDTLSPPIYVSMRVGGLLPRRGRNITRVESRRKLTSNNYIWVPPVVSALLYMADVGTCVRPILAKMKMS